MKYILLLSYTIFFIMIKWAEGVRKINIFKHKKCVLSDFLAKNLPAR